MMDVSQPAKSSVVVAVVLFLVMLIAWLPHLDNLAVQQIDAGLNRALVTFGIAKSLDAAISVAQSAQVSIHLGVGMALTVGEALDPVNDLVEQFSSCILIAAVAFGVQKILVTLGAYAWIKIALTLLAGIWLLYSLKNQQPPRLLVYAFSLMLLARFALPLITIGGNALFENFMAGQYQTSQAAMTTAAADFNAFTPDQFTLQLPAPTAQAEQGFWDKLKSTVPAMPNAADLKAVVDNFKQKVDSVTNKVVGNIVNLLVVFLLQTLIFPIVIVWLLFKLAMGMFSALVK